MILNLSLKREDLCVRALLSPFRKIQKATFAFGPNVERKVARFVAPYLKNKGQANREFWFLDKNRGIEQYEEGYPNGGRGDNRLWLDGWFVGLVVS